MTNTWYPVPPRKGGPDAQAGSAAPADPPGAARGADEAEGPVSVGARAPAVPDHRGDSTGTEGGGGGRAGRLPLHRGVCLDPAVQCEWLDHVRAHRQPEGAAAH